MLTKTTILLACLGLSLTLAVPVVAHHAFGAEFDPNRPVLLKGEVTKVEWVNPHAWIHLRIETDAGATEEWMVEAGTPNTLLRRGFTKESLKPGTYVIVDGYQSKDRTKRANGRDMTFPDGTKLFMGSSGTGAPRDGKDPNEPKREKAKKKN